MRTLLKVGKIIELIMAANAGAALGFTAAAVMTQVKVLWLLVAVMAIDLALSIYADIVIDNKIKDIKERRNLYEV